MTSLIQISLIVLSLLGVGIIVFTKDIVHAAYALCLTLVAIAGVYVLLMAELLAVVQIMLYAGGVVILLAFGVMMTNRMRGQKLLTESGNVIIAAVVSIGIFSLLSYLISTTSFSPSSVAEKDQIREIGKSFFTEHVVAFELIAFILLVALVGAAYLAKMASDD